MAAHRSWSQISSYEQCPHAYYLERIAKVWTRPAAWFPMGTAVHKAIEDWELSERSMTVEEAQEVYRDSYVSEVNRYLRRTPVPSYWQSSGQYGGEADIPRRYLKGLEHVEGYIRYYTDKSPEVVPWTTPLGVLAIELPFSIDLDGVTVKGYIDSVKYAHRHRFSPGEHLLVEDAKSGAKAGDRGQLELYKIAVEEMFPNTVVKAGQFFMTKDGRPFPLRGGPYDLTTISRDEIVEKFHKLEENIQAERFPAKPEKDKCHRCPVADSCRFKQRR